jgi:hypothetical protein
VNPRAGLNAVKKSLAPTGNRTPAVQPLARRYTDCAMAATHVHLVPGLRMVEVCLHSPIYLHGVVLN